MSRSRRIRSRKNKWIATALSFFGGGLGLHKFYLEKRASGVFHLVFFWSGIPAIVAFFHGVKLLMMSEEEFEVRHNYALFPKVDNVDVEFERMRREHGNEMLSNNAFGMKENSVADEIQKLSLLMDKGFITFEEFEKSKQRLLKSIH